MNPIMFFWYLSVLIHAAAAAAAKSCPPLGPILPPVTGPGLSSNADVQRAARNLSSTLNSLLTSDNATSVAVQVSALGDVERPLFEFYHTAPTVNMSGAPSVTSHTQFRLGSVTKVFTVLAMLQQEDQFDWRTPISIHIPELLSSDASENDVQSVQWGQVTLDALASQLGGIPRDIQDLALLYNLPWAELGFPTLNSSDLPPCGVGSNLPPCNTTEYLDAIRVRQPVYAPYKGPVYSNAAYALLGLALERILQQNYTTIIQNNIFEPLGMKHSSVHAPHPKQILIPTGDSQWNADNGFLSPSGQLYTSITDLSTFALSILNSTLLTPVQTNHWLKPHTHTSSLTISVGAPWEIYRTDQLTPDGRVIDLYTKDGGIGEYGSYLVLVPDYDMAVTVLAAGSSSSLTAITESALKAMIPAVDAVSRVRAVGKYIGTYSYDQEDGNGSSNMTLVMTDAGMQVTRWFNAGKDILTEYAAVFQPFVLGLYPTGLRSRVASCGDGEGEGEDKSEPKSGFEEESWRGVYNFVTYPYDGFLDQCSTWAGLDGNVYGQEALDEFIFQTDAKGSVVSVRNSALRTVMYKQ